MLNIRVVMNFRPFRADSCNKKVVGKKTFDKWFNDLKKELKALPNVRQIGISHAQCKELAREFEEGLKQLFPDMHIPVLHTNPVIATHTGKDAFAIMY